MILKGSNNTEVLNNISYENSPNIFNESANSRISLNLETDPKFVDPHNSNFHLQKSSPALGKGIPLKEIEADLEGTPRPKSTPSIGAFEGEDSDSPPFLPTNLKVF